MGLDDYDWRGGGRRCLHLLVGQEGPRQGGEHRGPLGTTGPRPPRRSPWKCGSAGPSRRSPLASRPMSPPSSRELDTAAVDPPPPPPKKLKGEKGRKGRKGRGGAGREAARPKAQISARTPSGAPGPTAPGMEPLRGGRGTTPATTDRRARAAAASPRNTAESARANGNGARDNTGPGPTRRLRNPTGPSPNALSTNRPQHRAGHCSSFRVRRRRPRLRATTPGGLLGGRPGLQGPCAGGLAVGGTPRGPHARLPAGCRRAARRRPQCRGYGGLVCGPAVPGLLPHRHRSGTSGRQGAPVRGVRRLHGRAPRRPQIPQVRLPLRERGDGRRGRQGVVGRPGCAAGLRLLLRLRLGSGRRRGGGTDSVWPRFGHRPIPSTSAGSSSTRRWPRGGGSCRAPRHRRPHTTGAPNPDRPEAGPLAMQTPGGWRAVGSSPCGTTPSRPCCRIPRASSTSLRPR